MGYQRKVTAKNIVEFIMPNNEGLSYKAIGRITDRDDSTVKFWLDKYGIDSKYATPCPKRIIDKNGYILIKAPSWFRGYVHKNGRAKEHQVKGQLLMGRPLHSDEVVHHIDGDKTNNHPMNLQVMTNVEHTTLHHEQGDMNPWGLKCVQQ